MSRLAFRPLTVLLSASMLLVVAPALPAQGRGPVDVIGREVTTSVERTRSVALPISASHVALHWAGNHDANLAVAYSSDGMTFSALVGVEHDDAGRYRGSETFGSVISADGARFVRVVSDRPIARLSIVAIDSTAADTGFSLGGGHVAAAAVEQPAVISRAGWGANESLRFDSAGNELWPPEFYPVQKLTVHHTAGRNSDPDPAATVRAIYYYHAVTRGWGDIGYNFLIDESGRVYEGRHSRTYAAGESPTGEDLDGKGVTAAHVAGYNSGTVGVALLGTLSDQEATPAARDALERLLAWKAERHGIDPLATSVYTNPVSGIQKSMPNIVSHRDLAATECPGATFYATLPALRQAVANRISGTTPAKTVPAAPSLTASRPVSGVGVRLNWTVPADGGSPITQFRILRLKAGAFVRIATVAASTTTYRDKSTKRGRTYTYVVRAVNALGPGPYSNQASAVAR